MVFWVVLAGLTAAVVALIARPLAGHGRPAPATRDANLAVYRSQLNEIDADLSRGLIVEGEAQSAKLEISRRLLAEGDTPAENAPADQPEGASRSRWRDRLALASLACIPLFAISIYLMQGSPGLSSLPHAERAARPIDKVDVTELVARVEARLQEHPEDGAGWDVIAPIYLKIGRFGDAAQAFAQAIKLNGRSLPRLSGFGEAVIAATGGNSVPQSARDAFEEVVKLDPTRIDARFWIAVAKEQAGDRNAARADYEAILRATPAEAPWRKPVTDRLTAVGGDAALIPPASRSGQPINALPAPGVTRAPGPSSDDVAAASRMAPDARMAMIRSMVDGLAARLAADGGDGAGWQRLIRAYIVLGETDKAKAALERGRKALVNDAKALADLISAAKGLGLGS